MINSEGNSEEIFTDIKAFIDENIKCLSEFDKEHFKVCIELYAYKKTNENLMEIRR